MTKKGACYGFSSVLLIVSSLATITLTSINLNNLMATNTTTTKTTYIKLMSFNYTGTIEPYGPKSEFCRDESYLKFAWLSGFLTVSALLTGFMAWGVKNVMSNFTIVFLLFSSMTAFVATLVSCGANSSVLYCHVVLTGKIPSGILFIAILSLLESILSAICFFRVCCLRLQTAMDLKYGIEPLPDPWDLDLDTVEKDDVLIVESKKPTKMKGQEEQMTLPLPEKAPYPMMSALGNLYNTGAGHLNASYLSSTYFQNPQPQTVFPRITPVAAASNVPGFNSSFVLPTFNSQYVGDLSGKDSVNHTLSKQARVVLNAANRKVNHQNLSRHQFPQHTTNTGPAATRYQVPGQMNPGLNPTSSWVQPHSIDRVSGCPTEAFSSSSLPTDCITRVF